MVCVKIVGSLKIKKLQKENEKAETNVSALLANVAISHMDSQELVIHQGHTCKSHACSQVF